MKRLIEYSAAAVLMSATFVAGASPADAARYRTPDPKQSLFIEDLMSGKRPIHKTRLTKKQMKSVDSVKPVTSAQAAKPMATAAPYSTTFYFSAHPDDFLLFMFPYRDVILSDANVVFVIVDAGDAGQAAGPTYSPFYLARQQGSQRAIRFMADAQSPTVATMTSGKVKINGHYIYRTVYKNTTAYYMRLPDGNGDGTGLAGDGYASLPRLMRGEISSLRAVDGSTTYTSWADFVATLTAIVKTQATGSPNVWLNTHEPDTSISPGDHADHTATGVAVTAIQPKLACVNLAYHVGYSNAGLVNMDLGEIETKSAAFGNYASGMAEGGWPAQAWDDTHKSWLGGMVLRAKTGNGQPCAF